MSKTSDIYSGSKVSVSNYGKYKKAAYTIPGHLQLVYSTIKANESTPFDSLKSSQVINPVSGKGTVIVKYPTSNKVYALKAGTTIVIPAGITHAILNTDTSSLNLEIVYSPPLVASDLVQVSAPMLSKMASDSLYDAVQSRDAKAIIDILESNYDSLESGDLSDVIHQASLTGDSESIGILNDYAESLESSSEEESEEESSEEESEEDE